ncbi:hypothetical protein [Streptomyces vilmorinianum]|uniref:hypothetical protein n=1 Tax=Streptomyces vilmorinianum TaxID=3051092 RepID=UPI0015862358|nr:hypothetical protein [Streptomyces vilmorinianum]
MGWMSHTPRWAVALTLAIAADLLFVGAVSHIADLLRHGLNPYDWAPSWLNLYWSSLALFDTVAAALLIGGKRQGMDLACAVMATDIAANWYAIYGIQHSSLPAQPGLQRLTAFALLVLSTAPFIRRRLVDDLAPIVDGRVDPGGGGGLGRRPRSGRG